MLYFTLLCGVYTELGIYILSGVKTLVLDFANREYLSSAELRVLLAAQKVINKQGEIIILNVNETIVDIFVITGFPDILT